MIHTINNGVYVNGRICFCVNSVLMNIFWHDMDIDYFNIDIVRSMNDT